VTTPIQETYSQILKRQLTEWGLTDLFADVDRLIKEGLGEDAINVQLQQTDAYKRRFAANEQRIARGLSALSPAEYIAVEESYRRVMQSYGLPAGFWDQVEDFTGLIARDVAPDEVNERVKTARDAFLSADTETRNMWRELYGLSDGAGIAAVLDPDRALPIVERMAATARAGATAVRNGLQADRGRLESYVDQGFSASDLTAAFGEIGTVFGAEQGMAARFGRSFSQADSEEARIRGTASALRRQQELYASEQALFDTRAAADAASLSRRQSGRF
jgi:hypothetical protein